MRKYIAAAIGVLLLAAAALALVLAPASAYPTGWTSDVQIPGVTSGAIDIASIGAYVHFVRINGAGRVEYCRSTDSGATWSSPAILDLSATTGEYCPQVEAVSHYVYVAYRTKDVGPGSWTIAVRRSVDNGVTWDAGYFGYTTENQGHDWPELGRSPNGMVFLTYQAMSGASSGPVDVYFRQFGTGSNLGTRRLVSGGEAASYAAPCIEGEGTDTVWIAYQNTNGDIQVKKNVAGVGLTDMGILNNHSPTSQACYPDVAILSSGAKVFVWNQENTRAYSRTYSGMYWEDPIYCYNSAVSPLPDIAPNSGVIACADTNSVGVPYSGAIMLLSSTPVNRVHNTATDSDGTHTYVAVTRGDNCNFIKRTDVAAPSGTVRVNGQLPNGQLKYMRSTFDVDLENVVDDWNVTGTDPYGDSFTNGVTKAEIQISAGGGSWNTVVTLNNAPWSTPVSLGHMSGNVRYIRVLIYDTAGNVGTLNYDTLYLADDGPATNIAVSPGANSAGWNNTNPNVTLSAAGQSLDYMEYYVEPVKAGGGSKAKAINWTRYSGGFNLREGLWKVTAHSKDKAGNYGPDRAKNVYVDTTAPVCSINRPSKGVIQTGYDKDETFRITGTGTDANGLTWEAIYIDGREMVKTNTYWDLAYVWEITKVNRGLHKIELKAKDPAGNVGVVSKQADVNLIANNWYFAEGNTLPEMDEWLCVLNPGDQPARYQITFMLEDGTTKTVERSMSSHQRDTVKVKDYIPEVHTGVSVHIHTDNRAVVAERPMYFVYKQGVPGFNWKGGHDVMGINTLQKDWYFAEGTTRMDDADGNRFNEWLTLQNAHETATATVKITYMLGTGQNIDKLYQVGPHSRCTVEVAQDVGINQDVSVAVNSDIPIAAERPMYFNYHRYALDGSNVVGAPSPDTQWAFSEGCTKPGYQEWLTIQNPNGVPAVCEIKYLTGEGKVNVVRRTVKPTSRDTVNVLQNVGSNQDVSTILSSNVPVIAERPMYYVYGAGTPGRGWNGGDSTLGNPAPSTEYFLAEGTTISNFDTYYTLMNPDDSRECHVTIDYIFGDGTTQSADYCIKPHARMTINVRDAIRKEANVSGSIIADFPIVIERPMYFNYDNRGLTGGHDVQGYGTD